jgi:serine/threonine protein kinase
MTKNSGLPKSGAAATQGVVFGRYLLRQKIAHGGMAEVFLGHAEDAGPDAEQQVIKCILPELAAQPQFLGMFINEAQLAAQMKHPNIVRVLDFGEVGGRLYMVMEHVEGLDCWRFARRLHPWGEDHTSLAIWIVCQVLDALHYAHGMTDVNGRLLNVIHRDLSPSNIYLSLKGEVKLGDFGIAKIESKRYRRIQMIPKGKFGYVAPEQVEGRAIDKRADIFSIGVVLTELLIGKKMFSSSNQLSVMLDIKEGRLDALDSNEGRIEPGLSSILYKALARKPVDRYDTAAEFREALSAYIEDQGRTSSQAALSKQVHRAVELRDSGYALWSDSDSTTPDTQEITSPEPITGELPSIGPPTRPVRESEDPVNPPPGPGDDRRIVTPVTHLETSFDKEWLYTARLENGVTAGPAPFAHVIELICSDKIGPETMISVNGGAFLEASKHPELARHLPAYTPTGEVGEITIPDRRGSLKIEPPSAVILILAVGRENGMLVCHRSAMRKDVYFRDGKPRYVTSNSPDELLGEYLVSKEVIERTELETALSLLPKFNGHLGDTFIALGMLSAVELFHHIGNQIKKRFRDLVDWKYGHYRFYRNVPCRQDILEVSLDAFGLISEKLLLASDSIGVDATLGAMGNTKITPSSISPVVTQRLSLTSDIGAVLHSVSEPCRLRELLRSRPSSQDQKSLVQALYIASETGLWLLDGPSPPWQETR